MSGQQAGGPFTAEPVAGISGQAFSMLEARPEVGEQQRSTIINIECAAADFLRRQP